MQSLPDTEYIRRLCHAYCEASGRSEARVADLATGNAYFFKRLSSGKSCTVRTYCRVMRWFSCHWPEGLTWPTDIPRPAPQSARTPENPKGVRT